MDTHAAPAIPVVVRDEGIYEDVPAEEYRAGPEISKSGLDLIAKTPAHYIDREPWTTRTPVFGTAYHALILEPAVFAERYIEPPDLGFRSKADKVKWVDFLQANLPAGEFADPEALLAMNKEPFMAEFDRLTGKVFLTPDEFDRLRRMQDRLGQHKTAISLVSRGRSEVSAYWIDEETGERCRARADWYSWDNVITDLKTADSADAVKFARAAGEHRYHVQDAMYRKGFRLAGADPQHFAFVVQEKTAPFGVQVFTLAPKAVEEGYREFRRCLDIYHRCRVADEWPAYPGSPVEIDLMSWHYRREG
jgi:exodeoxyribonuclease VIII